MAVAAAAAAAALCLSVPHPRPDIPLTLAAAALIPEAPPRIKLETEKQNYITAYNMPIIHNNNISMKFMILLYFNMKDKPSMVALLGARMDGDNYGKLIRILYYLNRTQD